MRYYPLFLDLQGKRCLVVGAGQVGRRKIRTLLECGGSVLVVDTSPPGPDLQPLLDTPGVEFACRPFRPEDVEGRVLVIASTDNEEVNWEISRVCASRNVLCNIVDQPEKCSFILPALHTQGDLTVAVSTSGMSPALSKRIRKDLNRVFGPEYGVLVRLMGRLRPIVIGLGLPTAENTRIFSAVIESPILETLRRSDREETVELLRTLLPEPLHAQLRGLVDELC
jgi:precorrin-2 dehydrogenase / sirohydrochlorin ferrochelatase